MNEVCSSTPNSRIGCPLIMSCVPLASPCRSTTPRPGGKRAESAGSRRGPCGPACRAKAGWRGDLGGCRTVEGCRSHSSRRTRVPASLWLIYPNQHWFPYLAFSPSSEFQNGPIHASPEENGRHVYRRWTSGECGRLARDALSDSRRTEVFPSFRQERLAARLREEHVAAGGRDLADHREPMALALCGGRVPGEERLDRIGSDGREELIVSAVV